MILGKIIKHKLHEIKMQKKKLSLASLKNRVLKQRRVMHSLSSVLKVKSGAPHLICEMKKASPSEGLIRKDFKINEILNNFTRGGASAISILTDSKFFKGSSKNLMTVRKKTNKPILRKDFILDEYQVYESKLMGADAILLIVAILKPERLLALSQLAKYLGLEVVTEIHHERELEPALRSGASMIGINNRNLATLKVTPVYAQQMIRKIPKGIIRIVESGIENREDIKKYKRLKVDGFLVGTALMKSGNIAQKIKALRGKK